MIQNKNGKSNLIGLLILLILIIVISTLNYNQNPRIIIQNGELNPSTIKIIESQNLTLINKDSQEYLLRIGNSDISISSNSTIQINLTVGEYNIGNYYPQSKMNGKIIVVESLFQRIKNLLQLE